MRVNVCYYYYCLASLNLQKYHFIYEKRSCHHPLKLENKNQTGVTINDYKVLLITNGKMINTTNSDTIYQNVFTN